MPEAINQGHLILGKYRLHASPSLPLYFPRTRRSAAADAEKSRRERTGGRREEESENENARNSTLRNAAQRWRRLLSRRQPWKGNEMHLGNARQLQPGQKLPPSLPQSHLQGCRSIHSLPIGVPNIGQMRWRTHPLSCENPQREGEDRLMGKELEKGDRDRVEGG